MSNSQVLRICLLLSAFNFELEVSARRLIPVNKCCPSGEVLNHSSETPKCQKAGEETEAPVWADILVNNKIYPVDWKVTAMLVQNKIMFPKCSSRLEVHTLKPGMITQNGKVSLSKYESGFYQDNFCIERTESQDLVVMTCDACKENVCVQVCCPHGQAFLNNPDYDYYDYDSELKHCTMETSETNYPVLENRKDFLFVAPTEKYTCDKNLGWNGRFARLEDIFYENGVFKLSSDGKLRAFYEGNIVGNTGEIREVREELSWSYQEFCVVKSETEGEERLVDQIFVCHQGQQII